MSLDSVLNFAIPTGIFLFLGFKIYLSVQEPVDKFIAWIKEQIIDETLEENENRFDISYD